MVKTEQRITEMGLALLAMPTPLASYVPYTRTGNLIFTAGHIPFKDDMTSLHQGKLGAEYTAEEGAEFAKRCGLLLCSTATSTASSALLRSSASSTV